MRYYYDLHIHSALSPCGDDDMTPNNIVNMALLKGLDIIAVTDHNACDNAEAVMKAGQKAGLLVIPGMEIESAEEVHVLSLFPDLESTRRVSRVLREHSMHIRNREEIFGCQRILNEDDEQVGTVEELLITATTLSIEEVFRVVSEAGGLAIPAHVDRSSHSVLSNLGAIPDSIAVVNVELSRDCDAESFFTENPELRQYGVLRDSDAHYLWDISEKENYFETEQLITDVKGVMDLLRRKLPQREGSEA